MVPKTPKALLPQQYKFLSTAHKEHECCEPVITEAAAQT
jgi:hypothetical protein